jgi:hypothetical protein
MDENFDKPPIFGWADTPWTVAALLGAWGVMIGIEEFFLADVFMVLAGASATLRLARDCFAQNRRKWVPFVLWLAIIVAIVGVDIRLTMRKKESSTARSAQIPELNAKIENLNATIQKQNTELNNAQARTDQQVLDIQEENKQLRASIDKKDAALVSIAKQQYALNFFPQVFAVTNGTTDSVVIQNNGKTNVTVSEIDMEDSKQDASNVPALVISGGTITFTMHESTRKAIASRAPNGNADRLPIECVIRLSTLDKKSYLLPFTWLFDIKDGTIIKTAVIDRPIVEVK